MGLEEVGGLSMEKATPPGTLAVWVNGRRRSRDRPKSLLSLGQVFELGDGVGAVKGPGYLQFHPSSFKPC